MRPGEVFDHKEEQPAVPLDRQESLANCWPTASKNNCISCSLLTLQPQGPTFGLRKCGRSILLLIAKRLLP
jgi:hypothetical protein